MLRFRVALSCGAVVVSFAAAAWMTISDLFALSTAALPGNTERFLSFDDRFFPASLAAGAAFRSLDRSALAVVQTKVQAEGLLVPRSTYSASRAGFVEDRVDQA